MSDVPAGDTNKTNEQPNNDLSKSMGQDPRSDDLSSDAKKPMEQPYNDLSKSMGQDPRSDDLSSDAKKPMEQPNNDLSKSMGQDPRSDDLSSDAKKPMEQPNSNLSEVMGQLSVNSDENPTPSGKNLCDMPIYNVVRTIVEKSKWKERLRLRKVSKSLRELVDGLKPGLIHCDIYTNSDFIKIGFNENTAIYACPGTYAYEAEPDVTCEPIVRDDYEKIAFDDLAFALKNPRLKLNYFGAQFESFDTYQIDYSNLKKILVSNTHNLKVRSCQVWIYSPRRYCDILQYLEPGFLEKIQVSYFMAEHDPYGESSLDSLKKIALLEQWKQAKELELSEVEFDDFPMEYAEHFRRFVFKAEEVEVDQLIRIRNFLSTLKNFAFCQIDALFLPELHLLQRAVGIPAAANERSQYVSHYSIPNSDDYLEFSLLEESVEIQKIKNT